MGAYFRHRLLFVDDAGVILLLPARDVSQRELCSSDLEDYTRAL
jgi:hypothetical protein